MFKKLVQYFFQGVLLVAPVVIVAYILWSLFISVDGWLNDKISPLTGFNVPGLGILILMVLLTLLGFLGQTALLRPLKNIAGKFIKRIPLLNLLYSSINDLFSAFVGKEKKFNVPVKVLFNVENNLWKLGFMTKNSMEVIDNDELTAVYFPHSYNFSGELFLVPKERVYLLDLSPAEVMKFVVSAGVTRFENPENEADNG